MIANKNMSGCIILLKKNTQNLRFMLMNIHMNGPFVIQVSSANHMLKIKHIQKLS